MRVLALLLAALPAVASPILLNGRGLMVADEGPAFLSFSARGESADGVVASLFAATYINPYFSTRYNNYGSFVQVEEENGNVLYSRDFRLNFGAAGSMDLFGVDGQIMASFPMDGFLIYGPRSGDNSSWQIPITVTHAPEPGTITLAITGVSVLLLRKRHLC